jgi:hypothetical protein
LICKVIRIEAGTLVAVRSLPFDTQAFEYLTAAVIVVDDKQNVVYLNTTAAKLYNLAREVALEAQRQALEGYNNQEEHHDTN